MVELAEELRAELRSTRGGTLWEAREARREPLDAAYTALLDREDARVVLGLLDDVVVGFGVVELETLPRGGVLGIVRELFVEEGARAVGVGEAIQDELQAFCTHHGSLGVDVLVLPGHRAAKAFFEEQGFAARSIVMHRPAGTDERT